MDGTCGNEDTQFELLVFTKDPQNLLVVLEALGAGFSAKFCTNE